MLQSMQSLFKQRALHFVFCHGEERGWMQVRTFQNIGCVIMASGLSRRFGGEKLMAPFHGAPLIESIVNTAQSARFARLVVVTRSAGVAELCQKKGVACILHALPLQSDTVRLGTEQMGDMSACVFCVGDQPLVSLTSLRALAASHQKAGGGIHRLCWQTRAGNPVLFDAEYFAALKTLPPDKGGGFLARQHPGQVHPVPAARCEELWDADTPEQLEKLKTVTL